MTDPNEKRPRVALRIGALIVSWNRRDDTLACIHSLYGSTYPDPAVYVVDNGSTDDSCEAIAERYPEVRLIRSRENMGFAGGNNLGLARMLEDGMQAAFLVNDDVIVAEDAIERLVAGFSDPTVGVLAPKVLTHSDPDVIWAAGGLVDSRTGVAVQRHWGEVDGGQADEVADIDYAVGCAMLVKAEVIRSVGLMDTRYFLYYEEADWCRRARRAGFRIVYVPDSRVWHKVSLRADGRNNGAYYFSRNRLLYLKTGGAHPGRIAWVAVSDIMRTAAVHAVKGRLHESRLMLKAVADYCTNAFGRFEGAP